MNSMSRGDWPNLYAAVDEMFYEALADMADTPEPRQPTGNASHIPGATLDQDDADD